LPTERLNDKFRDELLNGEISYTLKGARLIIERWRHHFNTVRPHSSLGYWPPAPETRNLTLSEKSGIEKTRNAA
jgi:putative transposase